MWLVGETSGGGGCERGGGTKKFLKSTAEAAFQRNNSHTEW